jgi:hypothetical protein
MRTTVLGLILALSACDVAGPATPDADPIAAPTADAAALDRKLPPSAGPAQLRAQIRDLQAQLDALKAQLDTLTKDVDGRVVGLTAATSDLGDGTCAASREAGSGIATGRRQYQPLLIHPTTHTWGDPHEDRADPVHGVDVKLGLVDADRDGVVDFVALETDLDGDGLSDLIELGGDRDRDGALDDDAAEADKAHTAVTDQLCGATSHL